MLSTLSECVWGILVLSLCSLSDACINVGSHNFSVTDGYVFILFLVNTNLSNGSNFQGPGSCLTVTDQ